MERIMTMKSEISGFGGGYEKTCRLMLVAGLKWLEEHPNTDPKFHGWKNVYGIVREDNDDAKALSEAVVSGAPDRDCTGAMHQAVIGATLWIKENDLEKYLEIMNKEKSEGD